MNTTGTRAQIEARMAAAAANDDTIVEWLAGLDDSEHVKRFEYRAELQRRGHNGLSIDRAIEQLGLRRYLAALRKH